jgi:phage protein D
MATFWMCHRITINGSVLKAVTEVDTESTVESLSDTARIVLPFKVYGVPFDLEKRFKRGDSVKIELGYDDVYQTEFEGFVRSLSTNNPCVIECEDWMYKMRKEVKSKAFVNASVNTILKYVCDTLGFKLQSTVGDLKYDKFVIRNATGYEILDKIRQQFGISIYAKPSTIVANLKFTEKTGSVTFDMSKNVKAANLQYLRESDVKVQVKVKGVKKDNTATKEITVGTKGGEVVTMPDQTNISDEKSLEAKAKEYLKTLNYEGYRGELTSFGKPFCDLGYSAKVIDPDFAERTGNYYVKGVKVRFSSSSGYERNVQLGRRLT